MDSTIPLEFRRCFLSTLDNTLKEFTSIYEARSKNKLLVKEELGVLDRWINRDIAIEYTEFLKHDVEYVTSYLQILFVKDILTEIVNVEKHERPLSEAAEIIL